MSIENKVEKVLFTREDIAKRVADMGREIQNDFADKNLLVISLMKGSFIFTADLVREIKLPIRIEFMTTSSYGHGEESCGRLEVVSDIDLEDLSGYDVLICDDICDSAITMTGVVAHIEKKNPRSITTCVMLDKPSRRKVEHEPRYIGYSIPDLFIVGYGLNYGDYMRNIDHIFAYVDKEEK